MRDTILVLRVGPSSGFVFLFRVPVAEKTVDDQVVATGTGMLNINACRVATSEDTTRYGNGAGGNLSQWRTGARACVSGSTMGRWPPNVVFVHGPGCGRTCEATCSVGVLDAMTATSMNDSGSRGAARFYPQFADDAGLIGWVERLVSGPV